MDSFCTSDLESTRRQPQRLQIPVRRHLRSREGLRVWVLRYHGWGFGVGVKLDAVLGGNLRVEGLAFGFGVLGMKDK